MSTQFEFTFHTTVLPDGTLADPIPVEMYGDEVLLVPVQKKPPLPKNNSPENNPFFRKLTLDEIVAEQGGPKICTDPDKYFGCLSYLWDSPEDIEEFLQRRKEDI